MSQLVLLLAAAALSDGGVKFLDGSFDDALKAAGKAEKLVFVDFYTDT